MPISDIVDEIDDYLSRLRKAREILVGGVTGAPQKNASRRERRGLRARIKPAGLSRRRADENQFQSDFSLQLPKTDPAIQGHVASDVPQPEQRMSIHPELSTPEKSLMIRRVPAKRRIEAVGYKRHRSAKPALEGKLNVLKPAISLAGHMKSKIVVVTAEQAQREREQIANSSVLRPRLPVQGLSGKSAFEALFRVRTSTPEPSREE